MYLVWLDSGSIFYPGARHELLLETNKQEVFADIAAWLDKQLAKQ